MVRTLSLILYPILVHLTLSAGQREAGGVLLTLLGVTLLVTTGGGWRLFPLQKILFLGLASAGILIASLLPVERVLFFPPIIISVSLLALFGATLREGRIPLITQISRSLRGYTDSELDHYTRRVTQVWVGFFALMTLEVVALALFAPMWLWTLFTGFLNYLLALALFLGEYLFRIHHLSHHPQMGFWEFLRSLARVDWSRFRG